MAALNVTRLKLQYINKKHETLTQPTHTIQGRQQQPYDTDVV
jgi:hypothetical protein